MFIPLGDIKDGFKFELSLDREVLNSKVIFPIIRQALVERSILLRRDIRGISGPNGLGLVEFFIGHLLLFYFLCLLLLGLVIFFIVNFFDFGFFLVSLLLNFLFVILNFLQMEIS